MLALVMGVALHGWRAAGFAQNASTDSGGSPAARLVPGTTRAGVPADRTYFDDPDVRDIYVQKIDVSRTWSIHNPDPFVFTVTLSKPDTSKDRPVIIKMRPVMKDRGLGNGYAWRVIVLKNHPAKTSEAKAIDTPISAAGNPLPTGIYLMEAYQETDPASLPHAFGILRVTDEALPELRTTPSTNFLPNADTTIRRSVNNTSIQRMIKSLHVFTPVTVTVTYPNPDAPRPSIKSGTSFKYTLVPEARDYTDYNPSIMVKIEIDQIDNTNGAVKPVRTKDAAVPIPVTDHGFPAATDPLSIPASDDKDKPLPVDPKYSYQLKATRMDNAAPPQTTDLNITP